MTIPAVPRWDDWAFWLCDMNGQHLCLLNTSITSFRGVAIRGVDGHKLESAQFQMEINSIGYEHLSMTALQMLHIVPYGDDSLSLWGLIGKPKVSYDGSGWEPVQVNVVGVEYLLRSRRCVQFTANEPEAINLTGKTPDDAVKHIVRQTALPGTVQNDLKNESRDWEWGTLAVDADLGEVSGTLSERVIGGKVYDYIKALADKYEFSWELRPSVSGGVVTFTFKTRYPRYGEDRSKGNTDGNRPVFIHDIGGMIPQGEAYHDWFDLWTVAFGRGFRSEATDAALIASYGRWEGEGRAQSDTASGIELRQMKPKSGQTYDFEASSALTGGSKMRWMAEYNVGDKVSHVNARLGETSVKSQVIDAIEFSFPDKVLKVRIRWGEKEPTQKDHPGGGGGGGEGGLRPAPDVPVDPAWGTPVSVGGANEEGSSEEKARSDHVHKGVVKAGGDEIAPDAGIHTYEGQSGITVEKGATAGQVIFKGSTLAHTHSLTYTVTDTSSEAAHTHSLGYTATNTSSESSHYHTINTGSGTTGNEASHTHSISYSSSTTLASGQHDHSISGCTGATVVGDHGSHTHTGDSLVVSTEPAHDHSYTRATAATGAGSSHNHSMTTWATTTNTGTAHYHSYDKANTPTGAGSSHKHTYSKANTPTGGVS